MEGDSERRVAEAEALLGGVDLPQQSVVPQAQLRERAGGGRLVKSEGTHIPPPHHHPPAGGCHPPLPPRLPRDEKLPFPRSGAQEEGSREGKSPPPGQLFPRYAFTPPSFCATWSN